jgi:methylmalonyl-CoA carboxyltransferase small subunit
LKLRIDIDGKSYELEVEILEEDKPRRAFGYVPPHAPPTTLRGVTAAAEKPPLADAPAAAGTESRVEENLVVRSPVAGIVVRIKARPGQALETDDLIMVLEAMKMETHVTASHPGKVKAIRVAEGDAVKVDQILMDFD